MSFDEIFNTFVRVGAGLGTTIQLFVVTMIVAIPLGFAMTMMVQSKYKAIVYPVKTIIYLLRSTPLILQLLFIYFGLPYMPFVGEYLVMDRFLATILGFSINYAAYFAEIFRGGILSIDPGQYEAAKVLGMTNVQTVKRVVIPQMLRVAMPSVSNETITLVKDTSLMFTLAVPEVLQFAKAAVSDTGSPFPFLVAGVIYLVLNTSITWILVKIEKKLEY